MIYNCSFPFSDFIDFKVYLLGILLISVIFGYMFYKSLLWRNNLPVCLVGFLLMTAGGFLNLSTRLSYGCVQDYFSLGNFFSFNFADVMIALGLVLLSSLYFNGLSHPESKEKES